MRGEKGNFGKSERFEHFEDGFGGSFVGLFEGSGENADDRRNEVLESGLRKLVPSVSDDSCESDKLKRKTHDFGIFSSLEEF